MTQMNADKFGVPASAGSGRVNEERPQQSQRIRPRRQSHRSATFRSLQLTHSYGFQIDHALGPRWTVKRRERRAPAATSSGSLLPLRLDRGESDATRAQRIPFSASDGEKVAAGRMLERFGRRSPWR